MAKTMETSRDDKHSEDGSRRSARAVRPEMRRGHRRRRPPPASAGRRGSPPVVVVVVAVQRLFSAGRGGDDGNDRMGDTL